jgi:hypothetical protein
LSSEREGEELHHTSSMMSDDKNTDTTHNQSHGRLNDSLHLNKSLGMDTTPVLTRARETLPYGVQEPQSSSGPPLNIHSKLNSNGYKNNMRGNTSKMHDTTTITAANSTVTNGTTSLDTPLPIPSSWRRSDYAQRLLPELEHHIVHTSSGRKNINSPRNDSTQENNTNPERTSYALYTVLYNECSLAALANWAMLDNSSKKKDRLSADNKKTKKHKKPRVNHTSQQLEFPSPMFHLCGVCGGFGHYEVECELLQQQNPGKSQRSGSRKKKRKANDVTNTKRVNLDENDKKLAIAKLSKEIDAQRSHIVDEGTASGSDSRVASRSSAGAAGAEGNQSVGKHPCCKICFNRICIDGQMIACDGCNGLFHFKCLYPPLSGIPEGGWFCNRCHPHESDTMSVLEIEGCGEIEQRKRSVVDGSNVHSPDILGSVEDDAASKNESYLTQHVDRRHGRLSNDFFVGEICWVERFNDRLNLAEWWPAMVTDGRANNAYKVRLVELDEVGSVRSENEMRPFLLYYEEYGYRPFFAKRNDINHEKFRHALMQSVTKLGLKSLGQALQLSRSPLQMSSLDLIERNDSVHPSTMNFVGWEDAEIDTVDDIRIMAIGSDETLYHKLSDESVQNHFSDSFPSHNVGTEDCIVLPDDGVRMVAEFSVNEITGSIVSWNEKSGDLPNSTSGRDRCNIRYGAVVSVDVASGAALVRTIPSLCDGYVNNAVHEHDAANETHLEVAVADVGSSPAWIPFKQIRFVCNNVASRP